MVVNRTVERNVAYSYISQLPFMLHLVQETCSNTDEAEAKFRAMMWDIVDQVNNHADTCRHPAPIRQYHLELCLWRRYYSTAFPGIYPKETSTMAPPLSFENDTKVKRNPASNLHRIKPVNMGHYSNIPRDEQKHNINSNPVSIMKREGNTNPTEYGNQKGNRKTITFKDQSSHFPILDPVALPILPPPQRYVPSFKQQSHKEMTNAAASAPVVSYDGTGNSMHSQPGHIQSTPHQHKTEYNLTDHQRHNIYSALAPHKPPEHGFDPATGMPYFASLCLAPNGFSEFCGVDRVYYDQIARQPAFKNFRIRFQKIEFGVLLVWPECTYPTITSILHTNPDEWARFRNLYAFLRTWCDLANANESRQAPNIVSHLELNKQLWEAYDTSALVRPRLDERVMAARNGVGLNDGNGGNRHGGPGLIPGSTYHSGWQ